MKNLSDIIVLFLYWKLLDYTWTKLITKIRNKALCRALKVGSK